MLNFYFDHELVPPISKSLTNLTELAPRPVTSDLFIIIILYWFYYPHTMIQCLP